MSFSAKPATPHVPGATAASPQRDAVRGTHYAWIYAICGAILTGGIYLAGWGQIHQVPAGAGLLLLWYAGIVVGIASLLVCLLAPLIGARRKGLAARELSLALPPGYRLAVTGVFGVVVGLAATLLWQNLLGFGSNLELLLSPPALLGLVGVFLVVIAPALARSQCEQAAPPGRMRWKTWKTAGPLVLALALGLSVVTFATQFANPLANPLAGQSLNPPPALDEIYVMHADGSDQTRLTVASGLEDFGPAWSPDGSQIVFSRGTDLWVMRADGTGQHRLLAIPGHTSYLPRWSPDGQHLAFIAQTGDDESIAALYVARADGSQVTRLTHETAREYGPAWSPDSRRIAFGSLQGGRWHIDLINADGSGLYAVPTPADANKPSWSQDGQQLVFTSIQSGQNALYLMHPDGTDQRLLTASGDHATWASSGAAITFQAPVAGGATAGIFVIQADGTGRTELTRSAALYANLPQWSPDGSRIVYIAQPHTDARAAVTAASLGLASLLIEAALVAGLLLLILRHWSLPLGSCMVVLGLNGVLLCGLSNNYVLLPAAAGGGLVADLLIWWLRPSPARPLAEAMVAFGVPVVLSGLYLLVLADTSGLGWPVALWAGAILFCGVIGLLMWQVVGASAVK